MTDGPPRHPEQLDVPLVWELEPEPGGATREDDPFPAHSQPLPAGTGRLLIAAFLDLGVVFAVLGLVWGIAAAKGASLFPLQLFFAGLLGLEVASFVAVVCLAAWRGTPGLLLMSVQFADTVTLSRAWWLWVVWAASLVLFGVPLVIGRAGRRGLERLAGCATTRRSPPGVA